MATVWLQELDMMNATIKTLRVIGCQLVVKVRFVIYFQHDWY
jgi:hypothetical protein